MLRRFARQLGEAVLVVLAVATLSFVLLKLAPGDPFSATESSRYLSAEHREALLAARGLDQPIPVQYGRYLRRLAHGDFGESSLYRRHAWDTLRDALGNTILLAVAALLVDFTLGIALGLLQGTRPGSRLDRWLSAGLLALYSTPAFVLATLFALVFVEWLRWLPIGGVTTPWSSASAWSPAGIGNLGAHLLLPALTLGLIGAAGTARYQRAEVLEISGQDFLRTARAKGLPPSRVMLQHTLRNALISSITLAGISVPALLSGAVLVEMVFGWPGMGRLTVDAIASRDYDVVTGAAILAAAMVVTGSLAADLLYRVVDPRTRAEP